MGHDGVPRFEFQRDVHELEPVIALVAGANAVLLTSERNAPHEPGEWTDFVALARRRMPCKQSLTQSAAPPTIPIRLEHPQLVPVRVWVFCDPEDTDDARRDAWERLATAQAIFDAGRAGVEFDAKVETVALAAFDPLLQRLVPGHHIEAVGGGLADEFLREWNREFEAKSSHLIPSRPGRVDVFVVPHVVIDPDEIPSGPDPRRTVSPGAGTTREFGSPGGGHHVVVFLGRHCAGDLLAHELGHALGLGHLTDDPTQQFPDENLMSPSSFKRARMTVGQAIRARAVEDSILVGGPSREGEHVNAEPERFPELLLGLDDGRAALPSIHTGPMQDHLSERLSDLAKTTCLVVDRGAVTADSVVDWLRGVFRGMELQRPDLLRLADADSLLQLVVLGEAERESFQCAARVRFKLVRQALSAPRRRFRPELPNLRDEDEDDFVRRELSRYMKVRFDRLRRELAESRDQKLAERVLVVLDGAKAFLARKDLLEVAAETVTTVEAALGAVESVTEAIGVEDTGALQDLTDEIRDVTDSLGDIFRRDGDEDTGDRAPAT